MVYYNFTNTLVLLYYRWFSIRRFLSRKRSSRFIYDYFTIDLLLTYYDFTNTLLQVVFDETLSFEKALLDNMLTITVFDKGFYLMYM